MCLFSDWQMSEGGGGGGGGGGRRVVISVAEERRMELLVDANLLTSDLLDWVAAQLNLKEKEFFSLAFVDDT